MLESDSAAPTLVPCSTFSTLVNGEKITGACDYASLRVIWDPIKACTVHGWDFLRTFSLFAHAHSLITPKLEQEMAVNSATVTA